MVVKLSDRVEVQWFRRVLPAMATEGDYEVAVSNVSNVGNVGNVGVARVISLEGEEPFIAFSLYARWFRSHPLAGSSYTWRL